MLQIRQIKELKETIEEQKIEITNRELDVIELLWLLIDKGIDPIKEGYQHLIEEYGIDYDKKV